MTTSGPGNLLSALHRWAWRQDENFITDAYAHLLRRLLQYDPSAGSTMIQWLTNGHAKIAPNEAAKVSVTTQVTTTLGRPDVEIRTTDHVIYLEAKVESEQGATQLQRYLDELDKRHAPIKALVFLSRYPEAIDSQVASRVISKRWYQIASWLHTKLSEGEIQDPINVFLTNQFVEFLRERNITMERISWELPSGVKSLGSLITMLGEAISSNKWTPVKSPAWERIGYYLTSDEFGKAKPYFTGVTYVNPALVFFETNEVAVMADAVQVADSSKLVADRSKPGGTVWVNELALDSEETHFFALSRASQLQTLERFILDSLQSVERIRVR